MRKRTNRWLSLLTLICIIAAYCFGAEAALLDVGPTVVPSPPGHGYPSWYRDNNRVPLEPCLSQTVLPSGPACVLLADPGFNPALPVVFPTNFPEEMFYFTADTTLNMGPTATDQVVYVAALEGAYATGPVVPGDQIVFARIRVIADVPVAGTYRFIHPYGVETLVAAAPGRRAITFTRDIGIGAFTGPLAGNIGPWLVMTGFPLTIGAETFIGDPNVPGTVTGSPLGTNFFRVEGPAGSNLDGLGNNFIQTNLFTVAGKVNNAAIATPLTVDNATYSRDASGTQVNVFATTLPIANARTGLPPNPFALLGVSSALQFTDATATIPLTVMETNTPADGKFFAGVTFPNPATLPATVRVTNTADVPPTSVDVPLVDEVFIAEASYASATKTLKVVASSGDKLVARTLQAFIPGEPVALGTLAAGQLSVTFPKLLGTRTYNVPPASVTVKSVSGGGSATAQVTAPLNHPPVAVNDTATVSTGGSIAINVAANDTDPDAGDSVVPATVTIVTGPANGTAVVNPAGTITYTNTNLAFTGADIFTYTIKDTKGAVSNVATVTVTVVAGNLPPVATNDTAAVAVGSTTPINVIANDTSATSTINPSSLLITAPTGGTATANIDGTVTYVAPAIAGTYTFTYTVKDNATTPATSNAATVTVTVTAPNAPPVAGNDAATMTAATGANAVINVIANDVDPTGINPASVVIVTQPANGSAVANPAGTVTYTPAAGFVGQNTFTYNVKDTLGAVSNNATVTVTVNAPAVTELLSINRAEFQVGGAAWRVEGATTQRTAGETVKIFNSATVPADGTTGLIGTATVDTRGAWALQLKPGPQPNALRRFSVLSSIGGKLENITVVVR